MRHEEDNLQIAVADYLRYQCTHTIWWHTPNGGQRNPREGARFKRMGVMPGVPDILIFWRGGMGGIELKAGKNKQQQSQSNFQYIWQHFGGQYAVCRSIEQVERALREWGALKITQCPSAIAKGAIDHRYTAKPRKK